MYFLIDETSRVTLLLIMHVLVMQRVSVLPLPSVVTFLSFYVSLAWRTCMNYNNCLPPRPRSNTRAIFAQIAPNPRHYIRAPCLNVARYPDCEEVPSPCILPACCTPTMFIFILSCPGPGGGQYVIQSS